MKELKEIMLTGGMSKHLDSIIYNAFHNYVPKYGYIERTSCIGNLDFTDKRLPKYEIAV